VLEFVEFSLLLICIYGMYKGIEIGHPIYALLISNLIVPFIGTVFNMLLFATIPFENWTRLVMFINFLCTLFHITSWSIISVLRYIFIKHKERTQLLYFQNQWKPLYLITDDIAHSVR
jgi:hypothetical protein